MVQRPSAGQYLTNIKAAATNMVSGIKELASAEVVPAAKHAGVGGGLLAGAGVFALGALRMFILAGGFGLAVFFYYVANRGVLAALALGFVTMGVLALLVAALLGLIGKGQVSKVKAPTATIAEAKASVAALGDAVVSGVNAVELGVVDPENVGRPWLESGNGATDAKYVADANIVAKD